MAAKVPPLGPSPMDYGKAASDDFPSQTRPLNGHSVEKSENPEVEQVAKRVSAEETPIKTHSFKSIKEKAETNATISQLEKQVLHPGDKSPENVCYKYEQISTPEPIDAPTSTTESSYAPLDTKTLEKIAEAAEEPMEEAADAFSLFDSILTADETQIESQSSITTETQAKTTKIETKTTETEANVIDDQVKAVYDADVAAVTQLLKGENRFEHLLSLTFSEGGIKFEAAKQLEADILDKAHVEGNLGLTHKKGIWIDAAFGQRHNIQEGSQIDILDQNNKVVGRLTVHYLTTEHTAAIGIAVSFRLGQLMAMNAKKEQAAVTGEKPVGQLRAPKELQILVKRDIKEHRLTHHSHAELEAKLQEKANEKYINRLMAQAEKLAKQQFLKEKIVREEQTEYRLDQESTETERLSKQKTAVEILHQHHWSSLSPPG